MKLKRIAAVSVSSAALLAAGSGTAVADGDINAQFINKSDVLNCFSLRVLDLPVLSSSNDNIDCSTHLTRTETTKLDRHS